MPARIGFNKSGTVLFIIEQATNRLTTFVMQPDGTLGPFFRNPAREVITGDAPRDATLSQKIQHLFTLNNGGGRFRCSTYVGTEPFNAAARERVRVRSGRAEASKRCRMST